LAVPWEEAGAGRGDSVKVHELVAVLNRMPRDSDVAISIVRQHEDEPVRYFGVGGIHSDPDVNLVVGKRLVILTATEKPIWEQVE
jgi:ATP-dependent 26S proteasome regulatory subunit